MANTIANESTLKKEMLLMLTKVANYVAQKVWNENRAQIEQVVYQSYVPKDYNRTGEFKDAWDATAYNDGNKATGKMFYSPGQIHPGSTDPASPNFGQHLAIADGNNVSAGDPSADYLADIIYYGLSGDAWNWNDRKRDAWGALNKVVGRRKMKKYIEEGFRFYGVQYESHNKAIHLRTTK